VRNNLAWIAAAAFMLPILAGCQTAQGPFGYDAGSAPYQQFWAQVFDPFPEDDIAPAVDGGRPREFDRAPSEVDRARRYSRPPGW
jgi:hypothetical protein